MRKGSLAAATAALALTSLAAKVLGAVYRIPLTNLLGAEGMGLYQTFFPVYALFITLTSGALPAVVSRYAAYYDASGRDCGEVLAAAKKLCLAVAASGTLLFAAAAYPIAGLQAASESAAGYFILVPAVAAVAYSSVYRGWFLAKNRTSVCAAAQTAEQGIKLVFGLALAAFLAKYGFVYAVYGALAAVTLSEFAGAFILRAVYGKSKEKLPVCVDKTLFKDMARSMLPMLASALVLPIVTFVDSFAIVRLLAAYGSEETAARQQYGLLTGAVGTLVNLPVVVALSASVAVLPKLTSELVANGKNAAHAKTSSAVGYCLMFSLPCAIGFALFASEILGSLYPALSYAEIASAAQMLRIQSAGVVFAAAMQVLCASLQALGKVRSVMVYMAVGGACRLLLQAVLMPKIGIVAAPIAQCSMYALVTVLAALGYRQETGSGVIALNMFAKTALAGVIMIAAELGVTALGASPAVKLAVAVAVGAVTFFGTLFAVKAIVPKRRGVSAKYPEDGKNGRGEKNVQRN